MDTCVTDVLFDFFLCRSDDVTRVVYALQRLITSDCIRTRVALQKLGVVTDPILYLLCPHAAKRGYSYHG